MKQLIISPRLIYRILNEIALLKQLQHTNLIAFYGAWVSKDKDKVVFITELMSSGTLKEFCTRYPISCSKIKTYCQEILYCLDYLHTEVKDLAIPATSPSAPGKEGALISTPVAAASAADAAFDSKRPKPKSKVMHRDIK